MKKTYYFVALTAVMGMTASVLATDSAAPADSAAAKVQQFNTQFAAMDSASAVQAATSLVVGASGSERLTVAVAAVDSIAHTHTMALVQAVGAIAAKSPETAVDLAAEAARIHPDEALAITRAAVHACPAQAGRIVESVLFFAPSQYQAVAEAALEYAPASSSDVLRAVSVSNLAIKPYIDQALDRGQGIGAESARQVLKMAVRGERAKSRNQLNLTGVQIAQNNSLYGGSVGAQAGIKPLNVGSLNASASAIAPSAEFMPTPHGVTTVTTPVQTVSTVSSTSPEPPGGHVYSKP